MFIIISIIETNKNRILDLVSLDNLHKVGQTVQSQGHLLEGGVAVHPGEAGAGLTLQGVDVVLGLAESLNGSLQFLNCLLVTEHRHYWNVATDCLTERSQNICGGAALVATNPVLRITINDLRL